MARLVISGIILTAMGFSLGLLVIAIKKKRIDPLLSIAPALWLLHGIVFYIMILSGTNHIPNEFNATWSSVLRLQATLTIGGALAILLQNGRNHDS